MYDYEIKPFLQKILNKLSRKDKSLYEQTLNKIKEIVNSDPEHYKNLKRPLQHLKRVHVGSFILVFHFDKKNQKIIFENFQHHDYIYKKG